MSQQSPEKRVVNSIILKPRIAKLPLDLSNEPKKVNKNHMQPFLILANGEHAYQTNFAGKIGKEIGWTDLITLISIQSEQIFIRCADYNDGKEEIILGEGVLDILSYLQNTPKGPVTTVSTLYKDKKKVGEIHFELEFLSEEFVNLVRSYDPIQLKKGQVIHRKLKYLNQDDTEKNLVITSTNPELVMVKNPKIKIPPYGQEEIKLKITCPNEKERGVRVDVEVFEFENMVEESLFFRLRSE